VNRAGVDPGRTWWSVRWLEVIEDSGPALARQVQRGQALARRAGVERVTIERGRISGVVVDEQPRPHRVELRWPVADEAAWERAIAVLADELRFTAALLEGDLPVEAREVLAEVGVELVPGLGDVAFQCSCRERVRPCRHAIALWTAAATLFDRDVFALLSFRGRDETQLLAALRAHRGDEPAGPVGSGLDLGGGMYAARGNLDAVELHPAPVDDPATLFRQLGEPPGVEDTRGLERLLDRAAATAWRLAAGEGADAADEELLLAELRGQRVATPGSLAAALGRDAEEVREELDRLFAEGTVMRMGSGERAKYRASAS
jgi:hypothetical protein